MSVFFRSPTDDLSGEHHLPFGKVQITTNFYSQEFLDESFKHRSSQECVLQGSVLCAPLEHLQLFVGEPPVGVLAVTGASVFEEHVHVSSKPKFVGKTL